MKHQRRNAVTLLELVVVLAVLVALAAIVVPLIGTSSDNAREKTTLASMTSIRNAILGQYRTDMKDDVLEQFRAARTTNTGYRPLILPRERFFQVDNDGPTWSTSTPNRPRLKYLILNPGVDPATNVNLIVTNTSATNYRPAVSRGWNGPYLSTSNLGRYVIDTSRGFTSDYGENDDPAVLDGWGHPIVITEVIYTGPDIVPVGYYRIQSYLVSAGPDGNLLNADDNITLIVDDRTELIPP